MIVTLDLKVKISFMIHKCDMRFQITISWILWALLLMLWCFMLKWLSWCSPIMLTTKLKIVNKFWTHSLIFFKHVCSCCPFLNPHITTPLKFKCMIKASNSIRHLCSSWPKVAQHVSNIKCLFLVSFWGGGNNLKIKLSEDLLQNVFYLSSPTPKSWVLFKF